MNSMTHKGCFKQIPIFRSFILQDYTKTGINNGRLFLARLIKLDIIYNNNLYSEKVKLLRSNNHNGRI